MDKYEFNLKIEQINKLTHKNDYETAMKIADTIDWRRVRNIRLLMQISEVYEMNEEYKDAKEILLMAYERSSVGKHIVYKLVELSAKEGNLQEAKSFFKEYKEIAPKDPAGYLLQYILYTYEDGSLEDKIMVLETYKSHDFDEKWSYELARLYHEAGRVRECVSLCDSIALWFGVGDYVERALALKLNHETLTSDQQALLDNKEKLAANLKVVEAEFAKNENKIAVRPKTYKPAPPAENDPGEEPPVEIYAAKVKKERLLAEVREIDKEVEIEELPEIDTDKLSAEIEKYTAEAEAEQIKVLEDADEQLPAADIEPAGPEPDLPDPEPEIIPEPVIRPAPVPEVIMRPAAVPDQVLEEPNEPVTEPEPELEPETAPETESAEPEIPANEPEEEEISLSEETAAGCYHIAVRSADREEGLKLAVAALKKMHTDTGTPVNTAAKISGEKLNVRGVQRSIDKIAGKDLIIENAGDLNGQRIVELQEVMAVKPCVCAVVLIDKPEVIREIQRRSPEFFKHFSCIVGDSEQLSTKAFVDHACAFAGEVDCVIDDMGMLALYAIAEDRVNEGEAMTEEAAEQIIEAAAELAAKKSVRKFFQDIIKSRYDKDGFLILKEEHFKE